MIDAIIVTSVIDTPQKKLSYSAQRSVFNADERLSQTIATIDSIRRYHPTAKIFLAEGGEKSYQDVFSGIVDHYLYCADSAIVALGVRSKFKALGEIFLVERALKEIKKEKGIRYIFKLSGRYQLTKDFDLSKWNIAKANFKTAAGTYSTRLYSIPPSSVNRFRTFLYCLIPSVFLGISIERLFALFIPARMVNKIDKLGIIGTIGVNGDSIEE